MVRYASYDEVKKITEQMRECAVKLIAFSGIMGSTNPKKADALKKIEEYARKIEELIDVLEEIPEETW